MTVGSRVLAALARLPRPATGDVRVERDVEAKMPDGVVLLADRWYPAGRAAAERRLPTILMRTPYGRRQAGMFGRLFAERGYQMLIQSCRGTFGSGGEWDPFRNEQADGRATLEWVAKESWFGGTLGMFGGSYLGLTQWAIAGGSGEEPGYLRAVAPSFTSSDFRDAVVYPGGTFALETALTWAHQLVHQELGSWRVLRAQVASRKQLGVAYRVLPLLDSVRCAVGRGAPFLDDWLAHEDVGDPWWDPIRFGHHVEEAPPASLVGGWYDIFLPGQVADFGALLAAGREARLTVGPWSHVSPAGLAASLRDGLEWFDAQLLGTSGQRKRDRVRIFIMGERRWVDLPDWPPPADTQRWYLHSGGRLDPTPPLHPAGSALDVFRYDPGDPTPGIGGPSLNWRNAGRKNQVRREARADVLSYTSGALSSDVTVAGPVTAELHLRSSLDHTDFFVRLCDVSAKGRSVNLSDGILRLRPGDVSKAADGSFSLRIAMWPTANTFKRGHRVRLQVSSGAHPLFGRNTGSGESLATATRLCAAEQEVLHDADHPSALVLPVSQI